MTTTRLSSRWIGTAVIAVAVLGYAGLVVDGVSRSIPLTEMLSNGTAGLAYALVGGVILRHSSRNRIGIFVAVMGLLPLLGSLAEVMLLRDLTPGFLADLMNWVVGVYFFVFIAALVPLLQVFPTGTPMSGSWQWLYRVTVFGSAVLLLVTMFGPGDDFVNPFEITAVSAITSFLVVVVGVLMLVGLATGVGSLGVRFSRSRGEERAQLKWFFLSVVSAVVVWAVLLTAPAIGDDLGELVGDIAFSLPAVGIFIAVTRYGLFDIDRIVSRTVTYAVVALVVAGIYVVPVLVLPDLLGLSGDVAVAGATLLAAAAFAPLRRRVQARVDRRFNRSRYDAERIVSGLSGRVQALAERGAVVAELGGAAVAALHPRSVAVWLRAPGS